MIVNLTPHPVTVAGVEYLTSATVARLVASPWEGEGIDEEAGRYWRMRRESWSGKLGGAPLSMLRVSVSPGTTLVAGVPAPDWTVNDRPATWYIVSLATVLAVILEGSRPTHDLLVPHEQERDEQGRVVIGARGFASYY